MSYPGSGRPQKTHGGPPPQPPPYTPNSYPPTSNHGCPISQNPQPYFVPGTVAAHMPPMQPQTSTGNAPHATFITNNIYTGEIKATAPAEEQVQVLESSPDYDWVPATASMACSLAGRAVVGGLEGSEGSPLWVIRGWHNGDLIPGKYSVRLNSASVSYAKKEMTVDNYQVLCAKSNNLRWVPSFKGKVPPGAIPGGKTKSGETLYIGRAVIKSWYELVSVTPGKIHPSYKSCYIALAGKEVANKMYDVLCLNI